MPFRLALEPGATHAPPYGRHPSEFEGYDERLTCASVKRWFVPDEELNANRANPCARRAASQPLRGTRHEQKTSRATMASERGVATTRPCVRKAGGRAPRAFTFDAPSRRRFSALAPSRLTRRPSGRGWRPSRHPEYPQSKRPRPIARATERTQGGSDGRERATRFLNLVGTSSKYLEKAAAAASRAPRKVTTCGWLKLLEQDLVDRKGQGRSLSHQAQGVLKYEAGTEGRQAVRRVPRKIANRFVARARRAGARRSERDAS